MQRILFSNLLSLIIILVTVFIFFGRLFFPPSIFTTPDFARSDALHSNIPAKLELSRSLKSGEFPIWNNQIGQGFPVLAEGITGTFYIPNLIIFGLIPNELTIPTMYLSTFLIAAYCMFFLLRKLKLDQFSSLFGALSYTFCASMMLHVQHFNFIQAASVLPIVLYFTIRIVEIPNLKNALIITVIFSQLFFTGFVQIFAYSAIVFFSFVLVQCYMTKQRDLIKVASLYILAIFVSLIISSAQLLPTLELNNRSERASGLDTSYILKSFPMTPKKIASYINPFINGSAKDGTANSKDWESKGIYWESTSYIGIFSIIFALISISFLILKRQKNVYLTFAILALLTLLLSLGKYAPTLIFFSFPPLSLFRVPSRFILFTQLFLAILAAYGAKKGIEAAPKKFKVSLAFLIIVALTADIFINWWSYNPISSYKKWLQKPKTATIIEDKNNPQARIFSLGQGEQYNSVFTRSGWENKTDLYYFFRNGLDPNINLLFEVNQLNMFETLPTRRYILQQSILFSGISINNNEITINEKSKNILDNNNVNFIVSTKKTASDQYKQIFETEMNSFKYYIFRSNETFGLGKIYYDYRIVDKPEDYYEAINNVDIKTTAILEKEIYYQKQEDIVNNVKLKNLNSNSVEFEVKTEKPGIFIASISYFPGWKAQIDQNEVEIIAANINSQAVEVPAGTHSVEFKYTSNFFKLGLVISSLGYLLIFGLILLKIKRA